MKIYDEVILSIDRLVNSYSYRVLNNSLVWKKGDEDELIFKNETGLELGEGSSYGLSEFVLTSDCNLVSKDEVILIGDELSELKKNSSYARIVLVRVNDELMGQGNKIYQNIRKIDYSRYHVHPEGFMVRISSMNQKESIRVSKKALVDGISFEGVGKLFIDEYKKVNAVEAVKIIFINLESFPYEELNKLIVKTENITKALDHLVNKVKMDCHSCKLQVVCNEVEKLVEEDFNKKMA